MFPLLFFVFITIAFASDDSICDPNDLCTIPKVQMPLRIPGFEGCFSNIYAFGNSLTDTGNFATLVPPAAPNTSYGITWPGCPKGRFSDGHLIVDYFAEALGVSYTRPWLACKCGTNFAVAGATALPASQLIGTPVINISSMDELNWYYEFKRVCPQGACDPKALYLVGELGGNDYTAAALSFTVSPDVIQIILVPRVIRQIIIFIKKLIYSGAKNILVENIPQTSCTPLYKQFLGAFDTIENGCLVNYGKIVVTHNKRLKEAILSMETPRDVNIAIVDRYGEFFEVWNNPGRYGIRKKEVACCGAGGPYNTIVFCGADGYTVCEDPRHAFFWDFIHFTDTFNRIAVKFFLSGKYIISKEGSSNPIEARKLQKVYNKFVSLSLIRKREAT